mmetsp:Transcript_47250/g.103009  ORF Transcript_47250/g.103009 Transcript_47250/m.103009 type:complete len:216 (+) Transcript_47250:295-942(+)
MLQILLVPLCHLSMQVALLLRRLGSHLLPLHLDFGLLHLALQAFCTILFLRSPQLATVMLGLQLLHSHGELRQIQLIATCRALGFIDGLLMSRACFQEFDDALLVLELGIFMAPLQLGDLLLQGFLFFTAQSSTSHLLDFWSKGVLFLVQVFRTTLYPLGLGFLVLVALLSAFALAHLYQILEFLQVVFLLCILLGCLSFLLLVLHGQFTLGGWP